MDNFAGIMVGILGVGVMVAAMQGAFSSNANVAAGGRINLDDPIVYECSEQYPQGGVEYLECLGDAGLFAWVGGRDDAGRYDLADPRVIECSSKYSGKGFFDCLVDQGVITRGKSESKRQDR